ncbi:MAG: glycosyltransferase family 4 protein [Candidatus Eisenbacteria bacterium]
MRVLLLAWDERRNASARCRIFNLAAWLRARGIDAQADPPVGGMLGEILSRPGRRPLYRMLQRMRGGRRLRGVNAADAVILQRELFPFGPPRLERRLLGSNRPVIYDVDDALHIRPGHFHAASHALHRFDKADEIARLARAVVVASASLEAWARPLNARIARIPTPVDVGRFRPGAAHPDDGPLVVGWTGTAGNLAHLESIRPALLEVSRRTPFVLRIIGERPLPDGEGPPIDFVPWSLEREATEVPRFDVGIMPLIDSPYAKAKAGYKALVYMACGVPPIVSPVGTNCEILDEGVEGCFASTQAEWVAKLTSLLRDAAERRAIGERARARVVRERSEDAIFPQWLDLLREVT